MTTTTDLSQLVIHKLTKQQYDNLTPNQNDLYMVTDEDTAQIEWVTYGTTTYSEIMTAINAGKLVLCEYNNVVFVQRYYDNFSVDFTSSTLNMNTIISVNSSNTWSNNSSSLQSEIPAGTSGQVLTYTGTAGSVGSASLPTTMNGADGTNAGTSGLVPAPAATDNTKFLRGDGTWTTINISPTFTYDSSTETLTIS